MMNKDLVNYKNLFISRPLMEISLTWRCIIGRDSYYVFQTGYHHLKNYAENGAKIFFVRFKLMSGRRGGESIYIYLAFY